MDDDILENTRDLFERIVTEYDTDGRLVLQLQRLLSRHEMDMRNAITRHMSDMEMEIRKLVT
jgi:hypothetical protein